MKYLQANLSLHFKTPLHNEHLREQLHYNFRLFINLYDTNLHHRLIYHLRVKLLRIKKSL
jgi:hypothetical protein